jgi:mono/diheme cytochrome c family protein
MRSIHLTSLLAASTLLLALGIASAPAQETLPPGEGMEETLKLCGGCHSVASFRNVHRSAAMWEVTITNMIGFGMTISDAEFDRVLTYLDTYMGLGPPPPTPPAGR